MSISSSIRSPVKEFDVKVALSRSSSVCPWLVPSSKMKSQHCSTTLNISTFKNQVYGVPRNPPTILRTEGLTDPSCFFLSGVATLYLARDETVWTATDTLSGFVYLCILRCSGNTKLFDPFLVDGEFLKDGDDLSLAGVTFGSVNGLTRRESVFLSFSSGDSNRVERTVEAVTMSSMGAILPTGVFLAGVSAWENLTERFS